MSARKLIAGIASDDARAPQATRQAAREMRTWARPIALDYATSLEVESYLWLDSGGVERAMVKVTRGGKTIHEWSTP